MDAFWSLSAWAPAPCPSSDHTLGAFWGIDADTQRGESREEDEEAYAEATQERPERVALPAS